MDTVQKSKMDQIGGIVVGWLTIIMNIICCISWFIPVYCEEDFLNIRHSVAQELWRAFYIPMIITMILCLVNIISTFINIVKRKIDTKYAMKQQFYHLSGVLVYIVMIKLITGTANYENKPKINAWPLIYVVLSVFFCVMSLVIYIIVMIKDRNYTREEMINCIIGLCTYCLMMITLVVIFFGTTMAFNEIMDGSKVGISTRYWMDSFWNFFINEDSTDNYSILYSIMVLQIAAALIMIVNLHNITSIFASKKIHAVRNYLDNGIVILMEMLILRLIKVENIRLGLQYGMYGEKFVRAGEAVILPVIMCIVAIIIITLRVIIVDVIIKNRHKKGENGYEQER